MELSYIHNSLVLLVPTLNGGWFERSMNKLNDLVRLARPQGKSDEAREVQRYFTCSHIVVAMGKTARRTQFCDSDIVKLEDLKEVGLVHTEARRVFN